MKRTIVLLTAFAFVLAQAAAQNTGINTATPLAYLDVNGDLALRMGTINLPNAANADVNTTTNRKSVYRITNSSPLGASISGFTGGVDGRTITLINTTSSPISLENSIPASPSAAANQILTHSGNTIYIQSNGAATLLYDGTASRWRVISFSKPDAVAAINVWSQNGNDISNTNTGNVGIGTGSPQAKLDVTGTVKIADGTQAAGKVLTSDSNGLANWQLPNSWKLYGNTGNNSNAFIGTTDAQPLRFGVNGGSAGIIDSANANTAMGSGALRSNTTGINNVAIGSGALYKNTKGRQQVAIGDSAMFNSDVQPFNGIYKSQNTAIGSKALFNNTIGVENTTLGFETLRDNISGFRNVAVGNWALQVNNNGAYNTAIGPYSMYSNISGAYNTATGYQALNSNTQGNYNTANGSLALGYNKGSQNTAIGASSMNFNLTGNNNTALGFQALYLSDSGSNNVAIGISSLEKNKNISNLVAIGDSALFNNGLGATFFDNARYNTAIGSKSLYSNTTGSSNSAIGYQSLIANTTGAVNVSFGALALSSNTTGGGNSANGYLSLLKNVSGNFNVADGINALHDNVSGNNNLACGDNALFRNINGNDNIAVGSQALYYNGSNNNTAIGSNALYYSIGGNENSALGFEAGPVIYSTTTNTTAIGANARVNCNNCMVLGSINGVGGGTSNVKVAIGTITPLVDLHIKQSNETYPVNGGGMRFERQTNTDHWDIGADNGSDFDFALNGSAKAYINHVSGAYTVASDFRLKKDIKIVGTVLPSIMQLQPKTYHYKDNKNTDSFSYGFIAQEVEKLFPDFVTTKGADGMKAIAYQDLNVIAIKAIQEQQTQIEALQKQNADLLKRLEKLEAK